MSEGKATPEAPDRQKNGNLLVPADPPLGKPRRGSIASLFQHSNQDPARDEIRSTLDEKVVLPFIENGQVRRASAFKVKASADKDKPASKPTPEPAATKKSRKRRKTLHDAETTRASTQPAECLEVTQSRWVQSPEDPSREIVTLTGEVTNLDSEALDSSFRWIHYHREASSISFEDFEKLLDLDQGLYEDEAAVASKCIKEAKLLRRTFARGKYFEPTVHQVSDVMGTDVEKVPVNATFIAIPIFALMNRSNEILPYLNRHALRTPARHPIRSLLQYSNILALDTERDKRQVVVVTKTSEYETADTKPFVHVPEFWALVINMYTVITCAPFSSQVLLGENIQLVNPPTNRRRFIVKFTSLRGTLHDLRCQTWFGLLDAISRIEWHIKDIDVYLNDSNTEYKLIDEKYRQIDQHRWTKLAEVKGIRRISVRLVRIPEETNLTLEFAAKKLQACVSATWVLLGLPYQEDILELKLETAIARSAEQGLIDDLKLRLDDLVAMERKYKRSRYFNRMLLYAARAHILNPTMSTTTRKAKTRRAFSRVMMASKLGQAAPPDTSSIKSQRQDLGAGSRPLFYENRLKAPEITIRRASGTSNATQFSDPVPRNKIDSSFVPSPIAFGYGGSRPDGQSQNEANAQTSKTSRVWYDAGPGPSDSSMPIEYISPFNYVHPGSRPGSSANPKVALWSPINDQASLDRVPLRGADGRIMPAIVDPYSSAHSETFWKDYPAVDAPSFANQHRLLKAQSAMGRRHSSFGIAGEVLSASPMRLPLRSGDLSTSTKQLGGLLSPPQIRTSEPQQESSSYPVHKTRYATDSLQEDDNFPATLMEKAERRAKESVGARTPFFQWQSNTESAHVHRVRPMSETVDETPELTDMQNISDSGNGTVAHDVLTDIDSFISHGKYHDASKFDVSPSDYEDIASKKRSEVTALLQVEVVGSTRPSLDLGREEVEPATAKREFAECKAKLLLSVHGFLECFVNQDQVEARVLGKIWGIMYNICELQVEPTATAPYPVKRDIVFVQQAAQDVEKMEFKCKELLHMNHQLEIANDHAQNINFHVPPPLFAAFMDFVLFLLATHLAVWEFRVNSDAVNTVKDKVYHGLHQSHSIFLRMNEHLEMDLDQIGYESIRAADSILGLLLENALNISCRESGGIAGDDTEMDFDIVDIYSRYTSHAIDRAKQEASARVYEDIRLLREEIDTISLVLKHQYSIFHRMLDARESALQNLDKRFIYRVNTNLDEMIRHFATLSDYAIQAEFWARNSIEVRSEANNKTIYVFTAVTVIFLPLSFVTGLLGMNTFDIRNLTHGQWLFWATAVPLTLAVLVICLCIVNYKFRFRKRVRRFLFRNRLARSFKRASKNAYFHAGHAGYGLRLLLPFGLYQKWRVRNTQQKIKTEEMV